MATGRSPPPHEPALRPPIKSETAGPGISLARAWIQSTVYEGSQPSHALLDLAKAQVQALCERARVGGLDSLGPTLPQLLAEPDVAQAWVIDRLIEEGCVAVFAGPPYVGKTLMAHNAGLCVARGWGIVMDHRVDASAANVVAFYGEGSRRQIRNYYRKMLAGDAIAPETLRFVDVRGISPFPNLATPEGRAWYEAVLVEAKAKLAIFDSSTSLVIANRNDEEVAVTVMSFLGRLGQRHGVASILLHHVRKGGHKGDDGSPADRTYGAQAWTALADTAIFVEPEGPIESGTIRVHAWKIRDSEPDAPFLAKLDRETLTFQFVKSLESKRKTTGPKPAVTPYQLLEECQRAGRLTAKAAAEKFDVGPPTIRTKFQSAEWQGWLSRGVVEKVTTKGREPDTYIFKGPMP